MDSRELWERLEELRGLDRDIERAKEELAEYEGEDPDERGDLEGAVNDAKIAFDELNDDGEGTLEELEDLAGEVGELNLRDGLELIPERDFEDHARQLAEDVFGLDSMNDKWPYTCISWEQAAEELMQDYSSVEFQGVTYLYRA